MLETMILNDFGKEEDYNCAEKILSGANIAFELGLHQNTYKLSSGFGGGMATGKTCGAVVSALMVLGFLNTDTVAHKSPEMKALIIDYQETFRKRMGDIECVYLKDKFFVEDEGCKKVVSEAAKLLDELVKGPDYR